MKTKIISLILSVIMIILALCPAAYAQNMTRETINIVNFSDTEVTVDKKAKFLNEDEILLYDSASLVDIVSIDSKELTETNVEKSLEFVDNGSVLIIQNDGTLHSISEVYKKLDIEEPTVHFDFLYENCINVGYKIKCDSGEYDITPIMATVMCEVGKESEFSIEEELDNLRKSEIYIDVVDFYENTNKETVLFDVMSDDIAKLQMSVTDIKNNYYKNKGGYGYFYAKNKDETSWVQKTGYTCYGLAEMSMYVASEGKRSDGTVNDMVYCDFDATGMGGKYVLDFTTYMETINSSIQDYLVMNSKSEYTISYEYGWSGDSYDSKTAVSYTVNPNECTVSTQSGGSNKKSWVVKPNSNVKGQTWRFSPWILVKTNNTSTTATVNCGFSQFTVDDLLHSKYRTTTCLYGQLIFKNHKFIA